MEKTLLSLEHENVSYIGKKFKFQKKFKNLTFISTILVLLFCFLKASSIPNNSSKLFEDNIYINLQNYQTEDLPIDVIVGNAAPHIPVMIKTTKEGKKSVYNKEKNLLAINKWITSYPDEVEKYKDVIEPALKGIKVKSLSPTFTSSYNDTKAQYKMIASTLKW